ncbi:hypothetical protein RYX36_018998 [Vicia faba]
MGKNRNGWVKRFMRIFLMGGKQKNSKRGAVHTTGRGAHDDVAIELDKKLSRPLNPDELFMVTHKNKNGQWVDHRTENTYVIPFLCLNLISYLSTQNDNNMDGSEKLQLWKEDDGVNIQYGVSYLTQVTISKRNREEESQATEMARAEAYRACEEAALANVSAEKANANAREAMAETAELKRKFEEFQKQLFAWQSGQAGTYIVPSSVYPSASDHYDDDSDGQSLDLEGMNDGC